MKTRVVLNQNRDDAINIKKDRATRERERWVLYQTDFLIKI